MVHGLKVRGRHVFNGFTVKNSYRDGKFTIGKTYERVSNIDTYFKDNVYPADAQFVDDGGSIFWEAVDNFSPVVETTDVLTPGGLYEPANSDH